MKQQKWKSKSFALLLAIMMVFTMMPQMAFADDTVAVPQEAGSASSAQHVIVSTADELAQWGGVDFTGTIELANDINMNGVTMQPIKSLNGMFEGNGYTISNLTLSGEATSTTWDAPNVGLGLIAQLNGTVQNLKLENVQITSSSTSKIYAGAVVGMIEAANASITNCAAMGSITLPENSSGNHAGGMIGMITGSVDANASVVIKNCVSDITVSSGTYPGGVLGKLEGPYASLKLQGCAVLGNVNITSSNGTGAGIIGLTYGKVLDIQKTYFAGEATSTKGSSSKASAFLNFPNRGTRPTINISECYYNGSNKGKVVPDYTVTIPADAVIPKSTDELKALKLEGFEAKEGCFGGYPVPSWLTTLGAGPHKVTVTAVGASKVTLLSKDGATTEMTAGENGVFTASDLAAGLYTYTAETSLTDKDTATGTLVVGKVDKAMTITLPEKVADTEITVAGPEAAVLEVYQGTDANGTLMKEKSAENGAADI